MLSAISLSPFWSSLIWSAFFASAVFCPRALHAPTTQHSLPLPFSLSPSLSHKHTHAGFTAAVIDDGKLVMWGNGESGALGAADDSTEQQVCRL